MDLHPTRIIIVNRNSQATLPGCLDSLAQQSFADFRALLVDNYSQDASTKLVQRRFTWAELLQLKKVVSFSEAVNTAVSLGEEPLVAVIHSDTILDREWLGNMVTSMGQHPAIGFCASNILNADGTQIECKGKTLNLRAELLLLTQDNLSPQGIGGETFVPAASNVAAIYRRELLEELGGFDNEFDRGVEDIELCFRAQLKGYRGLYVPSAIAYHLSQHIPNGVLEQKHWELENCRNRLYCLFTSLPPSLLWGLPFHLISGQTKEWFRHRTRKEGNLGPRLIWSAIRDLGKLCRKRNQLQAGRRLRASEFQSRISVLGAR